MKKGFTLVELLAVIVILAVISLIATPMILNVIETARLGAAKSSALGYIDAVEKQIMINQLDTTKTQIKDGVYDLPMNNISVKGEQPSEGWIKIENGEITNYSMKIMDYIVTKDSEVTKGEIAEKPNTNYVCKRASVLHTEICLISDNNACKADGYTNNSEITYGNEIVESGKLNSGDAFDCDVNGDGIYDPETERFYYVSGLNGDNTSDTKVLIYYNNTTAGIPDNSSNGLIAYYSSENENWHGPVEAIKNLPTKTQWTNVTLTNTSRNITNELGTNTTNNDEQTIENPFIYKNENNVDYAARLLTANEINVACNITVGLESMGELESCKYLMENTKFSNDSNIYGYWLENPRAANLNTIWLVRSNGRRVNDLPSSNINDYGTRPAIEVLESNILY